MITKAINKDIDQILNLLDEVNKIHYDNRPDLFLRGNKYNKEELEKLIKSTPFFVYKNEDKVLGYIIAYFKENKELYIDDFCVDESTRGMGIGKKLYSYIKDFAKENGQKRITLRVWNFNTSAHEFYKHIGLCDLYTEMEEII
jgi:ribosomal protein S18 acetylase RimI-like enzyme